MLHLLTSPLWAPADQPPCALPLTVPAAVLVVLATHGSTGSGWLTRQQLALVFWPDAPASDALHHLRINLHRTRQLLASWGVADALQAQRHQLRLDLPTDLAQLRAAQSQNNAALLQALNPQHWLQNWRLPGFDSFTQWCDDTAQQLQADWLAASKRALPIAESRPGAAPTPAPPCPHPSQPGRFCPACSQHRPRHAGARAQCRAAPPTGQPGTGLAAAGRARRRQNQPAARRLPPSTLFTWA